MQEHKYSIREWSKDDRPREKLLSLGAENLSNSEILAILIQNGTKGKSAIELAKEVLRLGNDNLVQLGRLTAADLKKVKGIGEAKAIIISAALELGRRRQGATAGDQNSVTSSSEMAAYLRPRLMDYRHEVFAVAFLNQANRIRHFEIVSEGGITGTVADPRIILRLALEKEAVSIILSHNHPSGSLKPSKADEIITYKIQEAAKLFDVRVLDHIIVSDEGYFSFADEGMMG